MSDRTGEDELEKIVSGFDSEMAQQDENQDAGETSDSSDGEELSKEEIADKFDVRFAATPTGETQHLVAPEDDAIFCRADFTDNFATSEDPSPFNPICSRCRKNVTSGVRAAEDTVAGYRQWLANEIDGVKEPREDGSAESLRKVEMRAVVSYIKSLKENQ